MAIVDDFSDLDRKFPHACFKCGKDLYFLELSLANYTIKLSHLKQLWKSKDIEFYCCICYRREGFEPKITPWINTPRTRRGESDMFDAVMHSIGPTVINGDLHYHWAGMLGNLRPGDIVQAGEPVELCSPETPIRAIALDRASNGEQLFVHFRDGMTMAYNISMTELDTKPKKKSRFQRIKERLFKK